MKSQGNFLKWFRYGSLVLILLLSFRTPFVAQAQSGDDSDLSTMQEAADVPPVVQDVKIDAIIIDSETPPIFPTCAQLSSAPGDLAHYATGLHQIAGDGLLSGKDDVYSLSDGNAVQCFCPPTGIGIQTNWWKTDMTLSGWLNMGNGLQWNLSNSAYLAMNSNFDCNPPVVPNCTTLTEAPGDLAHYTDGLHQIAGDGLLSGSDDVYSQLNGNAVQCFCPPTGIGIQTNWWKTDMTLSGWLNMGNGLQWNLSDSAYLAMNSNFDCEPEGGVQPGANITVTKVVVNDNGGTAIASDFVLKVGQAVVTTGVLATNLPAGSFSVTESGGPAGYTATFSGDCDSNGHIILAAAETYACTITNNDSGQAEIVGDGGGGGAGPSASFTLTKVVVNDNDGSATASDFSLKVGGISVTSGVGATYSAGTYAITESGPAGYTPTFSGDCDNTGHITMVNGNNYSCTMTNHDLPALGGTSEGGGSPSTQQPLIVPVVSNATSSALALNAAAIDNAPLQDYGGGEVAGVSVVPVGGVEAGGSVTNNSWNLVVIILLLIAVTLGFREQITEEE